MKTNTSARHLVKIRDIMLVVLLATILGLEVYLGVSQAARFGDTSALQTSGPAAPTASFSDLMAAAR